MNKFPTLREAVNVPDALRRDKLVRRIRQIRENAILDRNTILHWNQNHPAEPIDTAFEDSLIAWCDGRGPMPSLPEAPDVPAQPPPP